MTDPTSDILDRIHLTYRQTTRNPPLGRGVLRHSPWYSRPVLGFEAGWSWSRRSPASLVARRCVRGRLREGAKSYA